MRIEFARISAQLFWGSNRLADCYVLVYDKQAGMSTRIDRCDAIVVSSRQVVALKLCWSERVVARPQQAAGDERLPD